MLLNLLLNLLFIYFLQWGIQRPSYFDNESSHRFFEVSIYGNPSKTYHVDFLFSKEPEKIECKIRDQHFYLQFIHQFEMVLDEIGHLNNFKTFFEHIFECHLYIKDINAAIEEENDAFLDGTIERKVLTEYAQRKRATALVASFL